MSEAVKIERERIARFRRNVTKAQDHELKARVRFISAEADLRMAQEAVRDAERDLADEYRANRSDPALNTIPDLVGNAAAKGAK